MEQFHIVEQFLHHDNLGPTTSGNKLYTWFQNQKHSRTIELTVPLVLWILNAAHRQLFTGTSSPIENGTNEVRLGELTLCQRSPSRHLIVLRYKAKMKGGNINLLLTLRHNNVLPLNLRNPRTEREAQESMVQFEQSTLLVS